MKNGAKQSTPTATNTHDERSKAMIEIKTNQGRTEMNVNGKRIDIMSETVSIFKSLLNMLEKEVCMGASVVVLKALYDEIDAGNVKPEKSMVIDLSILNKIRREGQ